VCEAAVWGGRQPIDGLFAALDRLGVSSLGREGARRARVLIGPVVIRFCLRALLSSPGDDQR
jgi:hypothetical protein